jgi:glycosyltransferase involved in cell wall biosynthesis
MTLQTIVSIIIPCYNQELWIKECIDSCLTQSGVRVEVIVIDDGSTDKSFEIIRRYGDNVISETGPNRGVNYARNRGLELATGKYVKFLDADDKLADDVLSREVSLLESSGTDVCYGDWAYIEILKSGRNKICRIRKSGYQPDMILWLLDGNWCCPLVYLYKHDFLREKGLSWNVHLGFPDDFEFILKVALKKAQFCYLPALIGYYREYPGVRLSKIKTEQRNSNIEKILKCAEQELRNSGRFNFEYQYALCKYYFLLAQSIFPLDKHLYRRYLDKIYSLNPHYIHPQKQYAWLKRWFDYETIEGILNIKRKIIPSYNADLSPWRRFVCDFYSAKSFKKYKRFFCE